MITIAIENAAKDLSRLVDQAKSGEHIVITRDDEPVAQIVAITKTRKPRVPGALKGKLDLPDSFFFDPLPDDELRLWSGESDNHK